MRLRIPNLPDDASTEERFLAIAQEVVTTTPAQLTAREREYEEGREARGPKKPGLPKGTAPKHRIKGG